MKWLCRRHHGDVPLERFVLRREFDLPHKQNRCESHCAVQEDGDEPALDVSFFMASGTVWFSSDHSRMTSRLTC